MSWSPDQLRLLRELGHEPMLLASTQGALPGPLAATAAVAAPGQDASVAATEASRNKAVPAVHLLAAALARAAGGRDLAALALDLERLRLEPALKRALWPRLRALRREH